MPVIIDKAIEWQNKLDLEEGIGITIKDLQTELQSELESWAEDLERSGHLKGGWKTEDLSIRSLVNIGKRTVSRR